MPGVRDHAPIVIEQFGGLWVRGDEESCPSDHFVQADNVQYLSSGVETRDSLSAYGVAFSGKILRMYDYVMSTGQSLLVLTDAGALWHIIPPSTVHGPLLVIPEMQDFGFVSIAGRAYITPYKSITNPQGMKYELGLQNQFVYVYKGDGTPARKAAGFPPTNGDKRPILAYNSTVDGKVSKGLHWLTVIFNGGQRTSETHQLVDAPGDKQIQIDNLPIGPGGTSGRNIVMTKTIPNDNFSWDFNTFGYYRCIDVLNNTETSVKVNFSDEELVTPHVAGGVAPPMTNALLVWNGSTPGFCDFGFHLVGVVYETDTGYLSAPGPEHFGGNTYVDVTKAIAVTNIPVSPNPAVKKRHLVSTKWIPEYNGDQKGYQFFFIPEGNIDDNTTTTKIVSYYDADLLDDASHLIDNFSEIPAGVNLNTYHSRMVIVGEYGTTESLQGIQAPQIDNRSIARLSAAGEPEAINKVDGIIITPLDGSPLTNCQEFRDILYLFKRNRTYAYSDNNDEPVTWKEETIDQGIGTSPHGIGTVLDSGGVNIDFLIIAGWSGLLIFNGIYARPELSWKIEDFWMKFNRNDFRTVQVINNSLEKKLWITLPPNMQNTVLHADYREGLDAKNIKWAKWIFDAQMHCATLVDTNKLLLGSGGATYPGIHFIEKRASPRDSYVGGTIVKIPDPTISTAYFGE